MQAVVVGALAAGVFLALNSSSSVPGSRAPAAYQPPLSANTGDRDKSGRQGTARMHRDPVASWKLVYGRARVSGPIVFFHVRDEFLHMVIPVAAHEIDAFEQVYFNDVAVEIAPGGAVLTSPWLRTPENTEWQADVADGNGDGAADGRPGDTFFLANGERFAFESRLRCTIGGQTRVFAYMRNLDLTVQAEAGLTFTLVDRDTWHWEYDTQTGDILALEVPSILDGAGNVRTSSWLDVTYVETAWIYFHHGQGNQSADPLLVANSDGQWTEAHRLRGHAYLYAIFRWDPAVYGSGLPNISAVIRGKRDILDPRTGLLAWTDNAALCLRDYMTCSEAQGGFGCSVAEIEPDSWTAAAALCDEDVPTLDGSERRYTLNGVVDTARKPMEVIQSMLQAMGASMPYIGGQWVLRPAEPSAPVLDLDESHLRGAMRVRPKRSRAERYNRAKGVFVSPAHGWQPTEYPLVSGGLSGPEMVLDLPQDFVASSAACQRLARIELARVARQIEVDYPVGAVGLQVAPCDVVTLTNTRLGWDRKHFRLEAWEAAEDGGFNLTLVEDGPEIHAWSASDQRRLKPAPPLGLPDVSSVQAVPSCTAQAQAGGMRVAWERSSDPYLQGYDVQWAPLGSSQWNGRSVGGEVVRQDVSVGPGSYQVRVQARNAFGGKSGWTYAQNLTVG